MNAAPPWSPQSLCPWMVSDQLPVLHSERHIRSKQPPSPERSSGTEAVFHHSSGRGKKKGSDESFLSPMVPSKLNMNMSRSGPPVDRLLAAVFRYGRFLLKLRGQCQPHSSHPPNRFDESDRKRGKL